MASTSKVWVDRQLDRLPQPRAAGRRWGFLAPKKPAKQMVYSEIDELAHSLPLRRQIDGRRDPRCLAVLRHPRRPWLHQARFRF